MTTIKDIRELIALMDEHKLEVLEWEGIKLVKTNHIADYPEVPEIKMQEITEETEDDILFAHERF